MPRLPAPIAAYIAAYNAGDVDAMLDQLANDALYQAVTDGGIQAETTCRADYARIAHATAADFLERHQRVTQAITVGDTTALRLRHRATPRRDLGRDWTAGEERAFAGTALFRLREGQIIRILDTA